MSDFMWKVDMYPHEDVIRLQTELTEAKAENERLSRDIRATRSVPSVPDEAIDLIRDALEGTPFDDMGTRDDDGLIFAAQMDWLQPAHHKAVVKLADALDLIQEKAK